MAHVREKECFARDVDPNDAYNEHHSSRPVGSELASTLSKEGVWVGYWDRKDDHYRGFQSWHQVQEQCKVDIAKKNRTNFPKAVYHTVSSMAGGNESCVHCFGCCIRGFRCELLKIKYHHVRSGASSRYVSVPFQTVSMLLISTKTH